MYSVNKDSGWMLVCAAREIKNKPVGLTIADTKLVIFKNKANKISILQDKCIHRHVSLSQGWVKNDCLVCPYHGASFDISGACVKVPSVPEGDRLPRRKVKSYKHHIDKYDYIWVNLSNNDHDTPNYFLYDEQSKNNLTFKYEIKAPALTIIENFIDTAHTGVVHKGLFRGKSHKKVEVLVKSDESSVKIETIGENSSESALNKFLNPKNKPITHIDEYIAPYNVKVIYTIGSLEVTTVSVITPISKLLSKVHTFISFKGGFGGPLLKLILKQYTKKILDQDIVILENQAQQLEEYNYPASVFFVTDKAISEVIRLYEHSLSLSREKYEGKEFRFFMEL